MRNLTREAFLEAYESGERNFRYSYLRKIDLSNIRLVDTDFSGSYMFGVNLRNSTLVNVNIMEADLCQANLRNTNLFDVNLRDSTLEMADLDGADIRGASMVKTKLKDANLINCTGLYVANAPFMSSRSDALYGGVFNISGELTLLFDAGCQHELTADRLREKVNETHGDGPMAGQYKAAILFIETCFMSDMENGRFKCQK
jgi:uncharacterized protein YjbI with pentapeptide repeats